MPTKAEPNPILVALREASLDEAKAVEFLEAHRWGSEPACPRCGSVSVYQMRSRNGGREKNYRWRCRDCKKMYSVRTGLVMEESRIPLRVWVYAMWRACASKKGISALQLHRETQVSYKSALFLMHRIRFAMAGGDLRKLSGIVEADETYIGGKPRYSFSYRDPDRLEKVRAFHKPKIPVFAVVERGGEVRASTIQSVTRKNLRAEIDRLVDKDNARLMTDELPAYVTVGKTFAGGHDTVNHSIKEYARGDVSTNTIEGFFGLLKRGLNGTFHSVSKKHLHRYVGEFEFRWNTRKMNDGERVSELVRRGEGRRLSYA